MFTAEVMNAFIRLIHSFNKRFKKIINFPYFSLTLFFDNNFKLTYDYEAFVIPKYSTKLCRTSLFFKAKITQ